MKKTHFLGDLFFTQRFFLSWGALVILFLFSYFLPLLFIFTKAAFVFLLILSLVDYALLFFTNSKLHLHRVVPDLLSNGDDNKIQLIIQSTYNIPLQSMIIDELPMHFQKRDFAIHKSLSALSKNELHYHVKPTQRGVYLFGNIQTYISSRLQLVQKRFTAMHEQTVSVYPSFLQLRKFQIRSIPNPQAQSGGRIRYRRGMSTEFDHVKEYTRGDDARTINWKASARKNELMVNAFMDEKSQQIFCIVDMGRLMKMPFDNLTLLDYSINAALMFSYVALQKEDKIGLLTFNEKINDFLKPSKSKKQFNAILETLYKQQTQFKESNIADVHQVLLKRAGQRSLLLFFTNFETYTGFERQLPYLRALNQKHLLCIIFFENTEVSSLHEKRGNQLEDIYVKTIADKFLYEKKMIVKELQKNGILVIYTAPQKLSISVVNTYLELKAKQII